MALLQEESSRRLASIGEWLRGISPINQAEQQQLGVLRGFLIGWLLLACLIAPVGVVVSLQPAVLPLNLSLLLLIVCPLWSLAILRRGNLAAAVNVAAFGFLFAHGLSLISLGMRHGGMWTFFYIPIVLIGLLSHRRLLLTVCGLSIAAAALIVALENQLTPFAGIGLQADAIKGLAVGIGPRPADLGGDIAALVNFTISVVLIYLLFDRFGGRLRSALSAALAREHELEQLRSDLEQVVDTRTSALQSALAEVEQRSAAQSELLAAVEQHAATIRDLSVPVIPITDSALILPLVGTLDASRLVQLQIQALGAVERMHARTVLLDVTAVPVIDTQVAQGLVSVVKAARLLGAEVSLVGVRPEVAQTIVSLGIDLGGIQSFCDLKSALR